MNSRSLSTKSIDSVALVASSDVENPPDESVRLDAPAGDHASSSVKLIWSNVSYSVKTPRKSLVKKLASCCASNRSKNQSSSHVPGQKIDAKEMTPLTADSKSHVQESPSTLRRPSGTNDSVSNEGEVNNVSSDEKISQPINSVVVTLNSSEDNEASFRTVLQFQSGHLISGTMTALMGPSGAGKTTLLNCITARIIEGVTGSIVVRFESVEKFKRRIRVGFVPQKDHLFEQFTVKETLLFADKINIRNYKVKSDRSTTNERLEYVLMSLDLKSVANEKISSLSGGQVKRTSIAAEMISKPEILILDEPTSGLDSDNSEKVTALLSNLCTVSNVAICCTIHQPAYEVFNLFDAVYMLNRYGACVYFGAPKDLVATLISFGFREPSNVNPADYAIEIANGRFGTSAFSGMAKKAKSRAFAIKDSDVAMADLRPHIAQSFLSQVRLLFVRSIHAQVFSSRLTVTKLFANMLMSFMICTLFEEPTGDEDGCWSSFSGTNITRSVYVERMAKITGNMNFLFMACLFYMFTCSVTSVMLVASEIVTITKETSNSWYMLSAYFVSRTIVDLLLVLLTTTPSIIYKYIGSKQIWVPWRFSFFYIIMLTFAAIWDAKGILIGSIFASDYITGLCICTMLQFPSVFFSGFYVKESGIFWLFRPFSFISDLKYTYESLLIIIYGFHRCTNTQDSMDLASASWPDFKNMDPIEMIQKFWPKLNLTKDDFRTTSQALGLDKEYLDPVYTKIDTMYKLTSLTSPDELEHQSELDQEASYVLSYYGIEDKKLFTNSIILFALLASLRLAIYVILWLKTRRRRL